MKPLSDQNRRPGNPVKSSWWIYIEKLRKLVSAVCGGWKQYQRSAPGKSSLHMFAGFLFLFLLFSSSFPSTLATIPQASCLWKCFSWHTRKCAFITSQAGLSRSTQVGSQDSPSQSLWSLLPSKVSHRLVGTPAGPSQMLFLFPITAPLQTQLMIVVTSPPIMASSLFLQEFFVQYFPSQVAYQFQRNIYVLEILR